MTCTGSKGEAGCKGPLARCLSALACSRRALSLRADPAAMGLLVKNLRGTAGSRYKIGRLSHRFATHTGASVHKCQAAGCCEPAGATAHVIPANGGAGRTWLLCRVCKGHNSPRRTQPYRLQDGAVTVPVTELRAALKCKARVKKAKKAKGAAPGAKQRGGGGAGPRARAQHAKPKQPKAVPGAPSLLWAAGVAVFSVLLG